MKKTASKKRTSTPTTKRTSPKAAKRAAKPKAKATRAAKPKAKASAPTKRPSPKRAATKRTSTTSESPAQLIDAKIAALGDWRGKMLGRLRALIKEADPEVVEAWKWGGVPVWEHDGIITTGETYKAVVKLTFAKGASLPDPAKVFNSSLEGNTRRAIDFPEGATIDEAAFKTLVRDAVALNRSKGKR